MLPTNHVVDIFPVVQSYELEGGEHGPRKRVKVGEPEIGIVTQTPEAGVITGASPI